MQRKLKDSEQRSTLWARRAGAAEARVPVQATSARLPRPQGLFTAGQDPALLSAGKAGLGGTTASPIGSQAVPMGLSLVRSVGDQADLMDRPETLIGSLPVTMGRPAAAIGKPAESRGNGVSTQEGPRLQQGRAAPGQQGDDDEEEHEEGCALALLQEALSGAPSKAKARMSARQSTTLADGMTIGARHMQTDESVLAAAAQLEFAMPSTRQLSSLQQRIADYEKQSGLAALQRLSSVQSLSAGNDGKPSSVDDAMSPLKQRIAEYNAQHIMCESPRSSSSPRIDSRFENSSNNH